MSYLALIISSYGVDHRLEYQVLNNLSEVLLPKTISRSTIKVWKDRIPIRYNTKAFVKKLEFNPLWMISSETLLSTAPKDRGNS